MRGQNFVELDYQTQNSQNEQGFSLIEMLVAMVIFTIVTGAIYGLLEVGRVGRDRSSTHTEVLRNTRIAINLIGRDAVNAGLGYGAPGGSVRPGSGIPLPGGTPVPTNSVPNTRDTLSAIITKNNAFPNDLSGVSTDMVTFAYRDTNFNNGKPVAIDSVNTNGGTPKLSVDLNSIDLGVNRNSLFNDNDLYLIQTSGDSPNKVAIIKSTASSGNTIKADSSEPLGINQSDNGLNNPINESTTLLRQCAPPTITTNCSYYPATLIHFFWVGYRVKQDGTLVRISYGNVANSPQIQEVPLAYNVENLQFKYLLEDGTVVDDPSNNGATPANLYNIRQITVTVTVRGGKLDPQTNQPIKVTMSSTFSTRNLKYGAS